MGTIYKRGQTYWLKYYRNGKPYYESTRSTKEADAKKLLKKREGEISEGKLPGVYFDRVRFDELAEDFLTDYRVNQKKSLKKAKESVAHLKRHFEGYRAIQITTPRIQDYIEMRQGEGAANATINRELSALKRMLNMGARQTPPKVDRIPYIPMLKENNTRKGFFEHGDYLALKGVLPDYLKGFITFAYKTGWRISEISNLTWSQVDLEAGIVRLEAGETKNDEARTVYLDEELREVFNRQWKARKESQKLTPYVFLNNDGTDKIKRFDKSWKTACKMARIGSRLFHDFRRTAVRNMIRAGIPERVAMMVSGHKTRSVFERYNIVNDADLRLASQRQEVYLNSQKVTKTVTIGGFDAENADGPLAQSGRAADF
ncbi:MAG: tyrosine-type recombinase/integrase [Deltaproteobacteria bacterium]|nr:MAG: tyrosine-type recombinase/integrase [Deltaproteobacteria bacterium]